MQLGELPLPSWTAEEVRALPCQTYSSTAGPSISQLGLQEQQHTPSDEEVVLRGLLPTNGEAESVEISLKAGYEHHVQRLPNGTYQHKIATPIDKIALQERLEYTSFNGPDQPEYSSSSGPVDAIRQRITTPVMQNNTQGTALDLFKMMGSDPSASSPSKSSSSSGIPRKAFKPATDDVDSSSSSVDDMVIAKIAKLSRNDASTPIIDMNQ